MDFRDVIFSLVEQNEQACNAYFSTYQDSLVKSVKVITHKIDVDVFETLAKKYARKVTPPGFGEKLDSYYIQRKDESIGLGKHRLHEAGFFYIQEVAASLAAPVLSSCFRDTQNSVCLLDMCAAPGGKTIQLADYLLTKNTPGIVVSNEVNATRMSALEYNIRRTGCFNTCTTSYSGEFFGESLPQFFDGVLVDAPCSGEGTGFKSDAGTKRRREENAHTISHIQKSILASAIKTCKPGGYIVYATCTINPRENEMVVQDALANFSDSISLEDVSIKGKSHGIVQRNGKDILSTQNATKVARFWPHIQGTGGFFIAKFHKKDAISTLDQPIQKSEKKPKLVLSQLDMSNTLQETIAQMLKTDFGIDIDPTRYFFVGTENQIYLTSPEYKKIHTNIFTKKIGVPIFKKDKKTLIPIHGLGALLGHLATLNTLTLSDQDLQKYADGFDGESDFLPTTKNNFIILKYKNYGISVGKIVNGTIKNKFLK